MNIPHDRRLLNLLAAAALAINDTMAEMILRETGLQASLPAAVTTVAQYPGISVEGLRRILGITHSACVRLVDSAYAQGLMRRDRGQTKRDIGLHLTARGKNTWNILRRSRAHAAEMALGDLTAAERQNLEMFLEKILRSMTEDRQQGDKICRLCDESVCPERTCPVACKSAETDLEAEPHAR